MDLQTMLAAVVHRLAAVEARLDALEGLKQRRGQDELLRSEALRIALKIGTDRHCLENARLKTERAGLARELRARGWTNRAIAGVLNCSERTVERGFHR